jgi:2-(1,2-epoxy-1,2-dihydrophenyl)acetyl-CoA isomerase
MEDPVKLEITEGLARLTLNRPKAFNAFDKDLVRMLCDYLIGISRDQEIAGVMIHGEGKCFCAGGNLKAIFESGLPYGRAFHALAAIFHQTVLEIRNMPKPVIAAIHGPAAGGGFSLALACDFRIMEKSATFVQAYTSNGLSIDGGGTFILPRIVGLSRALEIAAFDRPITSEQAASWGLVTEVVEDGKGPGRAMEMLSDLKKRSMSSFAASKRLFNMSFQNSLETQLERERELLSQCADLPSGREGIRAFMEKRKPVFSSLQKGHS